jgi:hypothetical protein
MSDEVLFALCVSVIRALFVCASAIWIAYIFRPVLMAWVGA